MKSVAAITLLAGSAAAFAPAPVARVESSLSYAAELDSMVGVTPETGNKVVRIFVLFKSIYFALLCCFFWYVCALWLRITLACPFICLINYFIT